MVIGHVGVSLCTGATSSRDSKYTAGSEILAVKADMMKFEYVQRPYSAMAFAIEVVGYIVSGVH